MLNIGIRKVGFFGKMIEQQNDYKKIILPDNDFAKPRFGNWSMRWILFLTTKNAAQQSRNQKWLDMCEESIFTTEAMLR